jgi:TIR domain
VGSVFISYRREDSEGQARALFQELAARLGKDAVFMDVDSIGLGRDFRTVLQERLASCDVMLALIGRDWLEGKDKSGRRRIENAGDFVRLEIAAALKRNIPVTPVLLHGAQMPAAEQLPEDLSDLAYRNGFELSHNRWESDVHELMKRLGLVPRTDPTADRKTGAATATPQPARKPWLAIAIVLAVVIAAVGGGFLYYQKVMQKKFNAEIEARVTAEANKLRMEAENAKPEADASRARVQAEAPKTAAAVEPKKTLADSSPTERKPVSSGSADTRRPQEYTHFFVPADFQLRISNEGSYVSRPFIVDKLDPAKDFVINFQIKSTRNGGSTRYGIAWNYTPEDFLLFTIHSMNAEYYSIGPGRSQRYAPFSRFSQGNVSINGEKDFDTLQIRKDGTTLVFAINGRDVWRTTNYQLTSNQFAFWVADFSDALIKSYTVQSRRN